MSAKMKNVLVALESYRAPLFQGIAEYARHHHWHLSLEMLTNPSLLPWGWDGDGILTTLVQDSTTMHDFLKACNKPTVNLEGRWTTTSYPRVLSDTKKAAKMTFRYFRAKGFSNFAFYGNAQSFRGQAFIETVRKKGFTCEALYERGTSWAEELAATKAWIKIQPKPLAVLCWTDYAGARFVDMAHLLGWRIPSQIAVMGMDNEELVCDCAAVRLTSMRTDIQKVGYQGAALLDHLMKGKSAPRETEMIPPREIIERRSTDTFTTGSPLVAKAVKFMRTHLSDNINVADIVTTCGVSRRGLEKAFLKSMGHTPHDALLHFRMKRARALLRDGHDKIADVARQVGITDAKHFSVMFKKATAQTPREYREDWRARRL